MLSRDKYGVQAALHRRTVAPKRAGGRVQKKEGDQVLERSGSPTLLPAMRRRNQPALIGRVSAVRWPKSRGRTSMYQAVSPEVSVAVATSKLASRRIGKTLTFTLVQDLSLESRLGAIRDFERPV